EYVSGAPTTIAVRANNGGGPVHGNRVSKKVAKPAIGGRQLCLLRPVGSKREYVGCTRAAIPAGRANDHQGPVYGNRGSKQVARCTIACRQFGLLRPCASGERKHVRSALITIPGGRANDRRIPAHRNRGSKKVVSHPIASRQLLLLNPRIDRDRVSRFAVRNQKSNTAIAHCHAC